METDGRIAIVGIGCRFPGADGPEQFWHLLSQGIDAITEIPEDRSEFSQVYDPDPQAPGKTYSRWGGFVRNIDQFDALFFGISPREAAHIDPQQRLLLETAWEAAEDAGIPLTSLAGTRTGVFVGVSTHDYGDLQMYPQNRANIGMHTNSGTAQAIAANRISYMWDLRGPSLVVDTACSSALTAVHMACQSLILGDSTVALAGGAQLTLTASVTVGFSKAAMLSKDGRCKAFDAEANGYVRSEGAGVIVLKPLAAALAAGDRVYAVIRASAVNQDGRTISMTVPSAAAQQSMIEEALQRAGIAPADVDYVEAHGTGTPVGDPIEASAIGNALRPGRSGQQPCIIGSVKTNIGHLEAASGIAGLIKVALALKHGSIPPSLHFRTANEAIDLDALRLRVITELEPWPQAHRPAIAGVNSFGFGGANAHVLLEGPSRETTAERSPEDAIPRLLTISARSEESLKSLAAAYADCLRDTNHAIRDVCQSAIETRAHHDSRVAIVGASRDEFLNLLTDFASGSTNANIVTGKARRSGAPPLAFVFSGMGPQWWGMGRQLKAAEPVFRRSLEQCDAILRPYSGWSLLEEFDRDETSSRIALPELAQVTNFALQVSLAELWASMGIRPGAVIGHSGGAMAAAYLAGVHSLEDALHLTFHRSRLQGRPSNQGKMLAVGVPFEEIAGLVAEEGDRVSLAAVNGPAAITLSGEADAIERIARQLQERQIFARILAVNIAYHSPVMDQIRDEFLEEVKSLRGRRATLLLISDTTGTWTGGEEFDAKYWWRAIRQPVLFRNGIRAVLEKGIQDFVEIGPHPVLSSSVLDCMREMGIKGTAVPSLRRSENERLILLRSLGSLYAQGCAPEWAALREPGARRVKLPRYPWDRKRHWIEASESSNDWYAASPAEHALLGSRLRSAKPAWEGRAGDGATAYLKDHKLQGAPVFPGAGYVEMALSARKLATSQPQVILQDVEFLRPLLMSPEGATPLQLALDPDKGHFEVFSSPTGNPESWIVHSRGNASAAVRVDRPPVDVEALRGRITTVADRETFYQGLTGRGLHLGPAFQGIASLWTGEGEALGLIQSTQVSDATGYQVHPALLDAAFQVLVAAADSDPSLASHVRLFLPVKISEVQFLTEPGVRFLSHARVTGAKDSSVTGDVRIFREDGTLCTEIRGLTARLVDAGPMVRKESVDDWLYDYQWESQPLSRQAARIRMPDSLEELRERAQSRSIETGWPDYYATVEVRLNGLASAYAFEALELGRKSGRFQAEDLAAAGWRRALAAQLLENLEDTGFVRKTADGWETVGVAPQAAAGTVATRLLEEFPNHRLDVELLQRCGPRLAEVLAGKTDGTEVLFAGDGIGFLESFYRESPAQLLYNRVVADVVSSLRGESLRILEVGGGTAGTTFHLLPQLEGRCERYTFTDVSPVFLDRAREKFSAHDFFATALFDLTRDPAQQGIEPGSQDLILAANVLHATSDVQASVNRLRDLLAPGGVLLLLEITCHPRWLDLVFGLTEGWWKFDDRQRRPHHPLMPGRAWVELLGESGMEQAAVIADRAPGEPAQSVLVARRPAAEYQSAGQRWMLLADRRGVANRLAALLTARGATCDLIDAADADLASLAADSAKLEQLSGILYCGGLDAPQLEDSKPLDPEFDINAASGCRAAVEMLQKLVEGTALADRSVVLLTAGAQSIGEETTALLQTPLWGLGRVVCKEWPNVRCQMIDVSAGVTDEELAGVAGELLEEQAGSAHREEELAFRRGSRYVHRLRRTSLAAISASKPALTASPETPWCAEAATGSLDQIVLRQCTRRDEIGALEVEVEIEKAGLNFRDIVLTLGTVPGLETEDSFGTRHLGLDLAGIVTRCGDAVKHLRPGDRVLGVAPGAFASHAVSSSYLVTRRPDNLSAQEAATIPVAFITAHYAIRHLARLARGESILIHAATGAVGLAAVQMARHAGARIFATAGSPSKRAYLESLGVEHVMDSRSTAFADEVLELTGGRGVDVILNSLAGPAIERGIAALAPYGRFLEIGKADIYQNHRMDLGPFRKNLSLFAVDLDRMCHERTEFVGSMLEEVVEEFRAGILTPPPQVEFPMTELSAAMKFMAQAKHIGKVVLTNHPGVSIRPSVPERPPIRSDGTYLVTGGMGGLGLVVARWLIDQGARSLVLIGRNSPSPETTARLEDMRTKDVRVDAIAADITWPADVDRVLRGIRREMPPLRGVIHAAMVLEDTALSSVTADAMERVLKPKLAGAWNLHAATREDPLDFFLSFSSITSLLGNPQQANYAAANCFLDALGPYRHGRGLPATTINWGVISGSGYVARHREVQDYLDRQGYLTLNEEQLLSALSALLRYKPAQAMAARIDWAKLSEHSPRASASPRIRDLTPVSKGSAAGHGNAASGGSILRQLESDSAADRGSRMETYLREQVARLLGASASTIDVERPISDLGLDSLIAAELTVVLERDLRVEVPGSRLVGASVKGLARELLGRLSFDVNRPEPAASASPSGNEPMDAEGDEADEEARQPVAASVPIAATPIPKPEPSVAAPAPAPDSTTAKQPANPHVNGHSAGHSAGHGADYSALDYSNWSPTQRAIRATFKAGFGALGRVETRGFENVPRTGACLLAVNHLSMADVPLLLTLLPRRAIILANERLKQNRIVDWLISDMGQAIYVTHNQADQESLEKALTVLRNGGMIALAPEGTRSRNGALMRGKTGVAWLATQTGVPVVPLAAWGQEKWRDRWKSARRIPIQVVAGPSIQLPGGAASPAELRQYTDRIMHAIAALLPPEYRGVYGGNAVDEAVATKDA